MFLHLWCPVWSFLGGCSTPEERWSGWRSGESSWPGGGWRRRRGGREQAPESWKSGFKIPHRPYNTQNLKFTRQPEEAHSDQVLTALCVHWSLWSVHFLFFKSESHLLLWCPEETWGGGGVEGRVPVHITTPMQSDWGEYGGESAVGGSQSMFNLTIFGPGIFWRRSLDSYLLLERLTLSRLTVCGHLTFVTFFTSLLLLNGTRRKRAFLTWLHNNQYPSV